MDSTSASMTCGAKTTNFELDTRSPLILRVPGGKRAQCQRLVEFVDIHPTLVELCGLPKPTGIEGRSMVPLLADPQREWKKAAFSQFPRGYVMGYSMRTERYRFTEWIAPGGRVEATELYDHRNDPSETANIADEPQLRKTVEELRRMRRAARRAP